MELIYIILLILAVGTLNVACLFVGAKLGHKVVKGESVSLPSLDPMKAIREGKNRREAERMQNRDDIILQNIDAYDGTGAGQKDVPRG